MDKFLSAMASKYDQMRDLNTSLRLSLALEQLEPRAFEHGRCKTRVRGNVWNYDAVFRAKFVVILGNGEEIEHRLLDAPYELWGVGAQEDYQEMPHFHRKVLDKKLVRLFL